MLRFAVASALQQSFHDFELLVVGDACTDDSAAVVAAVGDDRVRWINLASHAGHQAAPNNEGLRQARGDVIGYLGHDDLWLPHHLECMVRAIEGGADLAFGMTAMVGVEGKSIAPAPAAARYSPGMWIPPTSVVHRRHIVGDVGGWRDAREVPIDPEADLWRRVHDARYVIESVPRLTALKFPAIWRKDVYVDRPHHEQAHWFERLMSEPDLEAQLLGRMLSDSRNRSASTAGLVRGLLDVAASQLRTLFRRYAPGLYLLAKNQQRRRHRTFKGLQPRS